MQEILKSRARAGEKQRKHPHYLKGSLFCGQCGERISFMRVRGNGGQYDYLYCLGRHSGRTECSLRFIPVDEAERAVEDFCHTVRFPEHIVDRVREDLMAKIAEQRSLAAPEVTAAKRRITELVTERKRLARGVVVGSVPDDLAKHEYMRIDREREEAERVLATAQGVAGNIERVLAKALDLLGRVDEVYAGSGPQMRRLANQFFFERLLIDRGEVVGAELREPWATLQEVAQDPPVSVGVRLDQGYMVPPAGLEPATSGLEGPCSIQLS